MMAQLRPNGEYSCLWSIKDSRRSAITAMKAYDLTRDGVAEVVLGREDGRVEVMGRTSKPVLRLLDSLDPLVSVKSVRTIFSFGSSFAAKVISFTTEPLFQRAQARISCHDRLFVCFLFEIVLIVRGALFCSRRILMDAVC
jgi:hypothetical protein